MNEHLIIFGIVILLICVELSGCNQIVNDDTVSFQELNNHLAKYIGKNITMVGYIGEVIGKGQGEYGANFYDSSSNPTYVIYLEIPADIDVYRGMYKIEGIVREASLSVYVAVIEVTVAQAL